MTDEERMALAVATLRSEIQLLERWAEESLAGGWSTHQVKSQRDRVLELSRIVLRMEGV